MDSRPPFFCLFPVCHVFSRLTACCVQSSAALCFLSIFATWYAIISNHKSTTSCLRGAGIERSCPTANLVIFARHIVGFYSQLPLMSLSVIRCVTCRRSARRRCDWTGPLQRNFIHDIIKLLKDDVALGLGRCYVTMAQRDHHSWRSQQGEHAYKTGFLCFVLFGSVIRGGATRSLRRLRHERAGCSSGGESGCSPRKALPSGWAAALATRSVDIIAAGPSGVNKHAIHDYVCTVCGRWFCSSRWDGSCCAWAELLRRRRAALTSLLQVRSGRISSFDGVWC